MSFSYIRKAWHDTVMPYSDENVRSNLSFAQYFLGGRPGVFSAMMFLCNIIRWPPEFFLNLVAELFHYGNDQLMTSRWKPLLVFGFLGQFLFNSMAGLYRMVTSPVNSFHVAQQAIESLGISQNRIVGPFLTALNVLLHFAAVVAPLVAIAWLCPPLLVLIPLGYMAFAISTDLIMAPMLSMPPKDAPPLVALPNAEELSKTTLQKGDSAVYSPLPTDAYGKGRASSPVEAIDLSPPHEENRRFGIE